MKGKRNRRALTGLDRRYDVEPTTSIDVRVLETIPYEYPEQEQLVEITTDEFTAVCPYSGLPDFGRITVRYIPLRKLIELRSLKYYLLSYRNVGIYQEHAAARILKDLRLLCEPAWMRIELDYNTRGGLRTVVVVEYKKPGYRVPEFVNRSALSKQQVRR